MEKNTEIAKKLIEANNVFFNAMNNIIQDPFIYQTIIQSEIEIAFIGSKMVYFLVPNDSARAVLKGYLSSTIQKVVDEFWTGKKAVFVSDIAFVPELFPRKENSEKQLTKNANETKDKSEKVDPKKNIKKLLTSNLMPSLTFDTLLKVEYNKKAFDAVNEILENEEINFSPLFISAPSGMGKTHLLNALGNCFVQKGKTAIYIDSNTFTKNITFKLQNKDAEGINKIVDELSETDVIIFDDIQNYENKTSTLNVVFNIINNHIMSKKQIVIASDKTVDQLGGFEERLITRFAGGLTIEMQKPSNDDLIDVWKFKLEKEGLNITDWDEESLKFISRNYHRSIRDLEGALKMIKFHSKGHPNMKYTYATVKNIFSNVKQNKENITPEKIVQIVGNYYKIKPSDILGSSRKKEIVLARSIAIWVMRHHLEYKYKAIGDFFGGKDHTTIMNSVKNLDVKQKDDPLTKYALTKIEKDINKLN